MNFDMIKAGLQVIVLAVLFYRIYEALSQTKAVQILKNLAIFGILYLICYVLELKVMTTLLGFLALPWVVFLCVLYQPELRRTFSPGMLRPRFFRLGVQTSADQIENILSACQRLVQSKRGALIVFSRHLSIKSIIDSGTKLNADISSALIVTVFDHDTPLHDGALIIQGAKIVAAGCYLPLSGQSNISDSFGTRHRAALGMAEESDAIVLVVSEETGAISLAYNGNLYYQLEPAVIKRTLLSLFNNLEVAPDQVQETKYEAQ